MTPRRQLALWLGALLIVLGACGGDDGGTTGSDRDAGGEDRTTDGEDQAAGDATRPAEPGGSGVFCEEALDARSTLTDLQARVMDDPGQAPTVYATAHERLRAVDPPADIAEDWATITDFIGDLATALAEVDTGDPGAVGAVFGSADMQARASAATAASDRIDGYITEQCDAELPPDG